MKGLVFVGISSGVIFILTRRAFVATQQEQQAREDIFRDTLQASQHILLNYLNQMQLVNLEAENCKDFDRETLRYSHALSDQAAKDLHRLAGIETMSPDALSEAIQTIARANGSIGRADTKTTSEPQTHREANQAAQPTT
jgi:hypothetical protein